MPSIYRLISLGGIFSFVFNLKVIAADKKVGLIFIFIRANSRGAIFGMITIIKFRSYMVGPFLGSHSISLSPFSQTTSLNPLYTFIRARRIPLSLCWSWLDCRRNIFSFSPDKLGNYITPFVVVWQFFCA